MMSFSDRITTESHAGLLKQDLKQRRKQMIPCTSRVNINDKLVRVALYARVSLDEHCDDKRFQDPENQLVPLREFAKALGYEVSVVYVDKMSGANPARPEFRRMLDDASMRRFQGILVWKLDRFSREGIIPTMAYLKRLRDRKVFLRSMTESWLDTSNEGIAEVMLAIMSWMAQEERLKISERTKAGIARRHAIGQWHGGRPKKVLGSKL